MRTIALCLALALGQGVPEKDRVASLPGWSGDLPCALYSGYLDATPSNEKPGSIHMHYLFFESEGNPETDPLLIWSNGGPGAGSEFGLFTELGPLQLTGASLKTDEYNKTGIPTIFGNPFAWTKVANVLMYDSPAPVGFSYCNDDVGGDGYSCGNWDDTRTAKSVHQFVESWMKAFPKFAAHDLYLSGESYAGVYIPMLAREIVNFDSPTRAHLKGFAVGDGCVGTDVLCGEKSGPWFHIKFMQGHGQISDKLHSEIVQTCGKEQLQRGITDPACGKLVDQMDEAIGGYYGYNLYDECYDQNVFLSQQQGRKYWSNVPSQAVGGALNDYPCGGVGAMLKWLNQSSVKEALHVPEGAYFFNTDNGVGFNYTSTEKNLMPFYQEAVNEKGLRVLVYNGDTDPGLNSFAAENWTVALGFNETQAWRAWTLDGAVKVGGYVTRYANNFDFLTIRGSGHMVPEFKPAAALEFISRWLHNEEYQHFKKPGSVLV